jgi:alkaline phosphatase D
MNRARTFAAPLKLLMTTQIKTWRTVGRVARVLLLGIMLGAATQAGADVFMANGMKIGDVTQTSAMLWTRLTQHPELKRDGFSFPELKRKDEPSEAQQLQGHALEEMQGAVPGASGEARFLYWADGELPAQAKSTPWIPVAAAKDFTAQVTIGGLRAGTRYRLRAEGRSKADGAVECVTEGTFVTPPAADAVKPITFTVVTGQDYWKRDDPVNGMRTYDLMRKLQPDFFVHTGDMEYFDRTKPLATTLSLARFKWNRIYALPFLRAFHNEVSSYFIKDDHDLLYDDSWPGRTFGELTWQDAIAFVREQVPVGDNPSRRIRWGKDLEIWLPEGREYRSPNDAPDSPEKTIWGRAQKQWFFDSVRASDATFRILISPTPLVGPDRATKGDNHANAAFATEGRELREFIATQKNMLVICGDRHWQYISVDPATGVREYSSGPTSDAHAGGFSESDQTSMHRYLKIKGGFLSVTVERVDGRARAVLRHYGTNGELYNEDVVIAQ